MNEFLPIFILVAGVLLAIGLIKSLFKLVKFALTALVIAGVIYLLLG